MWHFDGPCYPWRAQFQWSVGWVVDCSGLTAGEVTMELGYLVGLTGHRRRQGKPQVRLLER